MANVGRDPGAVVGVVGVALARGVVVVADGDGLGGAVGSGLGTADCADGEADCAGADGVAAEACASWVALGPESGLAAGCGTVIDTHASATRTEAKASVRKPLLIRVTLGSYVRMLSGN